MRVRLQAHIAAKGFGFWAVEIKATGAFAGFTGVGPICFDAPFAPELQLGWRYLREFWGQGYAFEAAKASASHAFDVLAREWVVAYTTWNNARSRNLMKRLGMTYVPADDFIHPKLSPDHPLQPAVLYTLKKVDWPWSEFLKME